MTQDEIPVNEETYEIFNFLSGTGFWLLIAILLVAVVLYKKYRK